MSGIKTPLTDNDSTVEAEEVNLTMNSSLEGLQSDEQRRILDTVDQVRKCGLEGMLLCHTLHALLSSNQRYLTKS